MYDNKTVEKEQEREREEGTQIQQPRFRVPFGEGIRRRRHAANLTAAELGKMVGVVESTITRLEQRAGPPISHVLIRKIAAVFGVSADDLIKGSIPADLLTYSDPVTAAGQPKSSAAARPYFPRGSQVLVPRAGESLDGEAEGHIATLLADAITLEALSPQDLAALVRVGRAMREAAEQREGVSQEPVAVPRKERKRVRHTTKGRNGEGG